MEECLRNIEIMYAKNAKAAALNRSTREREAEVYLMGRERNAILQASCCLV